MTSPFTPTIELISLKDAFHIEEIVVTDYEVIVDKYDHIRCVDQTRHPSISLTCEAGAAKYASHVGNVMVDLRNIRRIYGGDDDVIRDPWAVTLSSSAPFAGYPVDHATQSQGLASSRS